MVASTILIIDDHNEIRENIAEILSLAGYKTLTAENGKKGVEAALTQLPDLIICDIMMPELDGYGVLHLLRKNPATINIPLIFLSAKAERSDFRKGMEMGADDYVTKPFEEIELLNAVDMRLKKADVLKQKYTNSPQDITRFLRDVKKAGLIDHLAEQYNIETYKKKQTLYEEGKRPKYLYYLVKGKAKVVRRHEVGKNYITDVFTAGDFVGYAALIENNNYTDSVIVLEESEIMQIPKEDFLEMIYGDINVAAKFIHILTQNVREKEERLLNLAYSSLRKRVARALLDLHMKYNTDDKNSVIDIARDDLAHYVGTATESLIRTISEFKIEKLIDLREGKIRIEDPEKLKNMLH